ncbi:MAG TPA: ribosome maturation factor RimP [Vicinamibacterales bacterium]|nr:ribosome maturation factor RimP [Vicinamibacterales bacterium]
MLDRLRATAARVAESHGLEIFDVQFRRESVGWVLRVIVDRVPRRAAEGARGDAESAETRREDIVGIEDCQHVSRDLSAILDVEEELTAGLAQSYTLEVSSPGLDRPLRHEADYRRFVGRLAKLVTREPIERQTAFAGRLAGFEDGHVLLEEGRRVHRVPLAAITRAKLEVEF